ncbi:MAG: tetratricopeptide repeat protein [Gemmatimonadota bacterium]|jgi:tetratricopeptide (TPR) repeat protein
MPKSTVLKLDDYRERRGLRLRLATSLFRSDSSRSELMRHLARLAALLDADRVATVWLDEYGAGMVHPHVVLDLLMDRPRRRFSADPLRRAWEAGVPGVVESSGGSGAPSAWTLAVALGSDGTRSWFLVADGVTSRPALSSEQRNRVMFLAGECSAVVLHRDLDALASVDAEATRRKRPRFAGWPILRDIEGRERDEAESRRIALRFVVARLPRLLLEEDLAVPEDRLRQQAERAREEMEAKGADLDAGPERSSWEQVLDAFQDGDIEALGRALLAMGTTVESRGHLHGATELYTLAYELFAATVQVEAAVEAARFAGRCQRRLAQWDDAQRWYAIAREVAEAAALDDKVVIILDGVANIHRDRGNHPAARATLEEALAMARGLDNGTALGRVFHGLLALEHVAGNLGDAIRYGWQAIQAYDTIQDRTEGLASLAGALIDAGELEAAEDAWAIVAAQAEQEYYRLFALEALAYVAALRGDAPLFARRAGTSDAHNWEAGPALAHAEILLHRGLAYRALGLVPKARTWLARAVAYAEKNGFGRTLFEAEEALRSLREGDTDESRKTPEQRPTPSATVQAREGLREMRRHLTGAPA